MKLGLHLSIIGSIDRAIDRAVERGCNALQIFSRNPRGWRYKEMSPKEVKNFRTKRENSNIWSIFIHTPYLLNLASSKEDVYAKSVKALREELCRADILGVPFVVTHLGSHLGRGKREGFRRIVNAVDKAFSEVRNNVVLLLENTAGTRNSMGSTFDDIQYLVTRIDERQRLGVCFDTCHAFAAGYDLVSQKAVQDTLQRFDDTVGLEKLRLVHLNDSKGDLGSGTDRHEHIGMGKIGERGFRNILRSRLGQSPLILETPIDNQRSDVENLIKVRELAHT